MVAAHLMRLRTTLIVLLLGLLAALAIWKLGPERRKEETRTPLAAPELLDRWDEIELHLYSDERFKLLREPGGGVSLRFGRERPGGPDFAYKDPADLDRVDMLLNAIRQSVREPLQGDSDDLLRMGLDPPRCGVKIKTGERLLDLGFGIDDPAGAGVLARSAGEKQVFRTGAVVRDALKAANLDQWRSRTVFGVDPIAVTSISIARFDPKDPKKNEYVTVDREGGVQNWRLKEPRSLLADPQACASLAQQLSVLRVQHFLSQSLTGGSPDDEEVRKLTALPDRPLMTITVAAGPSAAVLSVGSYLPNQGYAAVLDRRNANTCFSLRKEDVDPLLGLQVDSLRPRRLFPRIETTLVGLAKCSPDGKDVAWRFARQGDVPAGKWEIVEPFHALANDGKGSGSFAQMVVELDRVEVTEFLDPKTTPFEPQWMLKLKHFSRPITREDKFQIAFAGGRTLVRDPSRPDELFEVKGKLAELLDLDPELFRDRLVFPRQDEMSRKVLRWRLEPQKGPAIEVFRPDLNSTPVAETGTDASMVPKLTPAAAALYGAACESYVKLKDVPGDPFAHPDFRLTLTTKEGAETLTVGSGGTDVFYCRLSPRLPDDVVMVVHRAQLQSLFDLIRESGR
ncbi:MAG TPA: DUF4340 domain-containing protein [Planctomycetota bacterium]|nr:DUF4340 domain-containing protein [Planctomycetota bacterium]